VSATKGSQNNYLPHAFGCRLGAWRIRTPRRRKVAQNPLQRRRCKYLNLRRPKTVAPTAHKLVFVGVAFALGVGEVRNTAHGPGIGSEPTTLRLTAS
jgi:hypothetical protein